MSDPTADARLREFSFLARLERENWIKVQSSADTPDRRMWVHLVHEGYVNGVTRHAPRRSSKIVVGDGADGVNVHAEDVEIATWELIVDLLQGRTGSLSISHKGSVRRSELEQALKVGRSTEPFGILLDGRYWERDLMIALTSASTQQPVTVAFIDMNGLKVINDTHGHEAGNAAIQVFLRLTREMTEDIGDAYRYGGDEVVAILPNIGLEAAAQRMIQLLKKLGAERLRFGTTEVSFSASIGIASSTKPDEPAKTLAKRADALQYEAKKASKSSPERPSYLCKEGSTPQKVD